MSDSMSLLCLEATGCRAGTLIGEVEQLERQAADHSWLGMSHRCDGQGRTPRASGGQVRNGPGWRAGRASCDHDSHTDVAVGTTLCLTGPHRVKWNKKWRVKLFQSAIIRLTFFKWEQAAHRLISQKITNSTKKHAEVTNCRDERSGNLPTVLF